MFRNSHACVTHRLERLTSAAAILLLLRPIGKQRCAPRWSIEPRFSVDLCGGWLTTRMRRFTLALFRRTARVVSSCEESRFCRRFGWKGSHRFEAGRQVTVRGEKHIRRLCMQVGCDIHQAA